jgi:hypothetical protein
MNTNFNQSLTLSNLHDTLLPKLPSGTSSIDAVPNLH